MDKILRAFAREQLQMVEGIESQSPQHKKLLEKGYQLYCELEEKLNSEEKELLERLLDINAEEKELYAEEQLIRGYRLGVLMTMEVFAGKNQLLLVS